ncbi:MAG: tRNA (uridine(34)/cytosine(34)/5-carboxymethylaminomethyluridine(34)-2'-O)-methyltransferase TrmL [Chloroflexi bacterium]|nr:tRNA (uridine(34)/cytosine(34)/5-carboxymethylaminomethyluridine(34)-2'-O)-methyltransferase TrmL [Chloroflexota bacterium]|tara:strand:- start:5796 stop:6269 length:474 start_codon:yes stop_codon:yes gene_type:complete
MFHIVLFEPRIAFNTGNIIRLCANTGSELHLIKPLGFNFEESNLRRAALDYRDLANVSEYDNFVSYTEKHSERRILAITPHAEKSYTSTEFDELDSLLFGSEDTGLPQSIIDKIPSEHCLRIPMMPGNRSLNLSNAASIVTYEAWRQLLFVGDVNCQ